MLGRFYENLEQASQAARELCIKTSEQYKLRYREDPKLPSSPWINYKRDWKGFQAMLGTGIYDTLEEASQAAQVLGIRTSSEYKARYREDPKLPAAPGRVYEKDWKGFPAMFGKPGRMGRLPAYLTLEEASKVARALGIKTSKEYAIRYREELRLPCCPNKTYQSEWRGFPDMLGRVRRMLPYKSLEEASRAVQSLGINSPAEYKIRYHEDPKLPSCPSKTYKSDWKGFPAMFGRSSCALYDTLEVASQAARALNIQTPEEYRVRYMEDPRLSANPARFYQGEWKGFKSFLRISGRNGKFYRTISQAREAALRLGITNQKEYIARYIEDDFLPSCPGVVYSEQWSGFKNFFAGVNGVEIYDSIVEASQAARRYGFLTQADYKKGYKMDPRLPSAPDVVYRSVWKKWGWREFLNTGIYSYKEAGVAARLLGVSCALEYLRDYKKDRRLPSSPRRYYVSEWNGWVDFFLPEKCEGLKDVKYALKVINIKNSREYRQQYKQYACLPAHPDRVFSTEWVSWYDLCDIPVPYPFEQLRTMLIEHGVTGADSYRRFVTEKNDPRIPRKPEVVYKDEWVNWYVFVNKPEPYQTEYIRAPYLAWAECVSEFVAEVRAGASKTSYLCRFVRDYIEKFELGFTPEIFFTAQKVDIGLFEGYLNTHVDSVGRGLLWAVKEFGDYIVRKKLTYEDEDTGERVVVLNARNPFSSLVFEGDYSTGTNGETNKPALAYQHVQAMCNWIIPDEALSFVSLTHLHVFEADWFEVDPSIIDRTDQDCVFKEEDGKTKLWFPGHWMHTFALASVPARGRQLAYCDSGEADHEIPQVVDGKIVWLRNEAEIAGVTEAQGFIKKYSNGNVGMHFTSNKTSHRGEGYSVPWIPEKLAIWIIRFREWQSKYNPVSRAMPWVECIRTDLNAKQLRAKGSNCFLFRFFGEEESGYYKSRLRDRLAASLFHSQSSGLVLAECLGKRSTVSSYKTPYSPHSMRVSLITAYVMEFGLPLDIVMKIAGHSSIIMSLYYVKINAEGLRVKFSEGEKKALSNQVYAAIHTIEQNRIDEIRSQLIQNNQEAISRYTGNGMPGSFLFRDYGFCPFAGTRCDDGGPLIGGNFLRRPIAQGYLGMQNCLDCRHFVTGPVFIGGLLSLANEISLQASIQFDHISDLNLKLADVSQAIDELDDAEYTSLRAGEGFDSGERTSLEMKTRKLHSELESAAKKADLFLCDIQSVSRLIKQSQAVLNEQASEQGSDNLPQLIVQTDHELSLAFEDSSRFHLLNEVCENAEIYESASAEFALPARSQMLDRMVAFNNMSPAMYALDKKQQLVIGNQLTNFLLSRVKSWAKVDDLISGRIRLSDLSEHERVQPTEVSAILHGGRPSIAKDMAELEGVS